ncbi:hypothetical protein SAMN02799625_04535 [Methylobacterium sp. UNC300MFChir4.1]|uniref:hypothetical protein n=1 Tax=Methylobacterium sp. UNC300MFChir4.1 TaxID=1502747 RepID=UPI0008BA86D7|nr:hypothetical protein [Methylobacterium sp. UNC300MFChir4.1]SEP04608.1 hypothetical protein SAMN02799625_04535 [Methylobacterium sp. UNC300MFChir4.1]
MTGYDEIAMASAEERDALCRALAEDLAEASGNRRAPSGFVSAERPRDLARALGRDRRERRLLRRIG